MGTEWPRALCNLSGWRVEQGGLTLALLFLLGRNKPGGEVVGGGKPTPNWGQLDMREELLTQPGPRAALGPEGR